MTITPGGYIYLLCNESMPGLVKIGRTQRDLDTRLRELNTTGVPSPFYLFAAIRTADCCEVERALHKAFGDKRVSKNREFFRVDPRDLLPLVYLLGEYVGGGYFVEEPIQTEEFDPTKDF